MLTQNRVQDALTRLPDDVQRLGVQVRKAIPSILMAVHLYSPDTSRDTLYLSNYATLHIKDVLARLPGVGDVQFQGGREYAMRIWLDPDKAAAYDLSAGDVLAALRAQNLQVSAGVLNQPPLPGSEAYQINVEALGRLIDARAVRGHHRQVRRPRTRDARARHRPGRGRRRGLRQHGLYGPQQCGDPASSTPSPAPTRSRSTKRSCDAVQELKKNFPPGVDSTIIYDPNVFIGEVDPRGHRHDFRGDPAGGRRRVPLPAELARDHHSGRRDSGLPGRDAFTILAAFGISLNNLSLFGLVLAVGIVVDDAIVVVENVERNMRAGMSPAGGGASHDGRSRRCADLDRADAVRRVRAVRFHLRHLRAVLPPVRGDDRGLDRHLLLRLADAEPGSLRRALQGA